MCDNCSFYQKIEFSILIIKLDALGDVLRTTSILHALKEKYPRSVITWLTKSASKDIFINNAFVNEVLVFENTSTLSRLMTQSFDLLINPDASVESSSLASIVNAGEKKGYILDKNGKTVPVNNDAIEWLELGTFDQLKKVNQKTYQQVIHEISGLEYKKGEIIINLTTDEKCFAASFFERNGLHRFKSIIGLNTGSSKRWELKQWGVKKYEELIKELSGHKEIGILLYGGKDEKEQNSELVKLSDNVIDTGADNSLREFFALVDLSNIFITGDTLALHTAAALKKKTIALFGPTSSNEIEDYGRILKVFPEMECLVCYLNKCDKKPNCMENIKVSRIIKIIEEILSAG